MQNKKEIGVFGLGAMGRNIALNIAYKGYSVSVYNRTVKGEIDIVKDFTSTEASSNIQGFKKVKEFVLSLKSPRRVLIMITAGGPVDEAIAQIIKYMNPEDIIIDGGNSNYLDTQRRVNECSVRYLGCGVSGGWYGALNGPSMMFGGSNSAWNEVQDLFKSIASKRKDQSSCCDYFGDGGSGHFIKMVHNGIEYAMMQSIAESYDFLKKVALMSNDDIALLFKEWNDKELNSYLMQVSSAVLSVKDQEGSLIDNVVDRSSQKGTGIDFSICSLKYGVATPAIVEATHTRFISFSEYRNSNNNNQKDTEKCNDIEKILFDSIYCSYVVSFFQGMSLVQKVSEVDSLDINLSSVASVWEEGCIVKSSIFKEAVEHLEPKLSVKMLLKESMRMKFENLSKAVILGAKNNIPVPIFSSSLNYYNSIIADGLPANLIQLQREYFGSHGFEKVGEMGQLHHFSEDHDA